MARILIVDDDSDIRESLADFLRRDGHGVETAADGAQALDRLKECLPCLIVLDLMMPVMDGWTFRARQRADPRLAPIPVAVLSGVHDPRKATAGMDVVSVIQKPRILGPLRELVQQFC